MPVLALVNPSSDWQVNGILVEPKLYANPECRSIPNWGFLDAILKWTSIPT
jgi:hypothetical protein